MLLPYSLDYLLLEIGRTADVYFEYNMAESAGSMDTMDVVDDVVRDDSEIFVCIKTPQDTQKVSVYPTSTVKQV